MTQNFLGAGVFLIQTFSSLYLVLVLLRFLMQALAIDYYNPICQAIVKITNPPVKPLQRLAPTIRGVDFATLLVAVLVQLAAVCLIMKINDHSLFQTIYIGWSLVGIISTLFDIYFWAMIIRVIASWIAPYSGHPAMDLLVQLTEPICAPARKLLPPMGGLDFSIILVFIGITLLESFLLVRPLAAMLGVPSGLIPGL